MALIPPRKAPCESQTASKLSQSQNCTPNDRQAAIYSAIRHYLRAIEAAGTDEAKAAMTKMREIPVNDFFAKNGKLREDGRLLHDMYFVQVKTPAESRGPWDYYKIIATIPGDQAFRPAGEDGCPLIHR
jgi:branched-chain amino acid transport system substrate-binding protein